MLDLANRNTLMRSLPHGGYVVEVGVERGQFSKVILAENQPCRLILVDSWCDRPGSDWQAKDPAALADHEADYNHVVQTFAKHENVSVRRALSVEAAQQFSNDTLDIVYIDADHTAAAEDIAAWWPKVKPGGWLCGHDYAMNNWITVKRDVDEFVNREQLPLLVTKEGWPSWAVQKPLQ